MATKKYLSWFVTEKGRTFTYYAAGAVSTTILVGTFLPHTILLDYYKNVVHLYKKGIAVPLNQKLKNRFQKALDLVEVDPDHRNLFKPFAVYGFDMFSAGSDDSRFGVVIGIPANFSYEKVEDVDKASIKVKNESVAWETEEAQQLQKSLVLSENAQLYAIAREIKYRQTSKALIDCFLATSSWIAAYGVGRYLNIRYNYLERARSLRFTMYGIVGAFFTTYYLFCKDGLQLYYEKKIDQELMQQNPIFVEGGKEFYSKMLERNKALRKLMGEEGEKIYSILGNENYIFRQRHMPIVHRLSLFQKKDGEAENLS